LLNEETQVLLYPQVQPSSKGEADFFIDMGFGIRNLQFHALHSELTGWPNDTRFAAAGCQLHEFVLGRMSRGWPIHIEDLDEGIAKLVEDLQALGDPLAQRVARLSPFLSEMLTNPETPLGWNECWCVPVGLLLQGSPQSALAVAQGHLKEIQSQAASTSFLSGYTQFVGRLQSYVANAV
jgi:hypothetical protein